ncbi:MAG: isoquinoline 1-oxidoreductase [Candidatus Marinimicrobia bacterium]|mgnify:CR=1 FL=1|nr:isoquinoline 1-oxidoreductase [Candidatus Neomarinimicrobiota bacterium]|tara:strand:+ start:1286 stop:3487 length:2202 start_codon:yes stop_codon:yes gene_type:complete
MTVIKTKVGRRSFLKTSAAVGGGLMIGFNWLVSCKTLSPKKKGVSIPEEWFDINGYIKIGDTGMVTIYSPNPEIGQNVMTSMPMIVAEELDVPWENVIVEQGALDEDSFRNPQMAGGSNSIKRGWDPLRMAGAAGKWMLLEATAKEWGISVNNLSASNGMITKKTGDRKIGYGQIASKAVGIDVPKQLTLKKKKDYKLIGTSQKNVEGSKIVTGKPLFGLDFKREGMLIAAIEHPPAFGMKVKSFNKKEIKGMDGVVDAFIIDSTLPKKRWNGTNAFPQIIAILGKTTWHVMNAKKMLRATWDNVGELETSEMHEQRLIKDIETGKVDRMRKDGDPDSAFANAEKVIERTYTAPFIPHNPMEPMNFFANVKDNSAELIGPTQTPKAMQEAVSSMLNIPQKNISIKMTRMGGGFGRRLYTHFGLEAAAISKKIGVPVKMVYTREDDMTQGTYRPAYRSVYKAGLDKNNNLIAFSVKGVGLPDGPVIPDRFPAGAVDNYIAESKESYTNISTGAWTAPSSNFTAGAEQSFLDEVAELAQKDPIDFRLELFNKAIKNPVGKKYDYDANRYAGVLKLVKEKSGWGRGSSRVNKGVAAYFCHNTYVAVVMEVRLNNNQPKLQKVWCGVDCGIVINKEGATNMIEGRIIDGIGHAIYSELKFENGSSIHKNFDTYNFIRHNESPSEIEVFFVENEIAPTGLGEPSLPPAIGALANALYKATGIRFYHQPFSKNYEISFS